MGKIERFEDLDCWKEARELVKMIYEASENGRLSKDFDTKSQLRRASLSVMNNIAEGFGRKSNKEFVRFLGIASSSAAEVKSMLYVLADLKYLNNEEIVLYHEKVDSTRKLTLGLIRYLSKL